MACVGAQVVLLGGYHWAALAVGATVFAVTLLPVRRSASMDRDIGGTWTFEVRMAGVFTIVSALVAVRVRSPTIELQWRTAYPATSSDVTWNQVWGPYLAGALVVAILYFGTHIAPNLRTPSGFDGGGGPTIGRPGDDNPPRRGGRSGGDDDERPDTLGRAQFGGIILDTLTRPAASGGQEAPTLDGGTRSTAHDQQHGERLHVPAPPPTYHLAALDRLLSDLEAGRHPEEDFARAKA